jgi:hypothetical protein
MKAKDYLARIDGLRKKLDDSDGPIVYVSPAPLSPHKLEPVLFEVSEPVSLSRFPVPLLPNIRDPLADSLKV